MRKLSVIVLCFLAIAFFLGMSSAQAIDLGRNITIWDGLGNGNDWTGGPHEDQEVEPNCYTGQQWDLEGFFLTNNGHLQLVGGFDFVHGEEDNFSGDLFIDVTGDVKYGPAAADVTGSIGDGKHDITNGFGYDYVLQLNFDDNGGTYNLFKIDSATLLTVYYIQNSEANPWRYKSGGESVPGITGGTFQYETGKSDAETGLLGGWHNAIEFDDNLASLLDDNPYFTAHFAIECGNDFAMASTVPEPSTVFLLGAGLIGLVAYGRKRMKKVS